MADDSGGQAGLSRRTFLWAAGAGSALFLLPGGGNGDGGLSELLFRKADGRPQQGPIRVGHIAPGQGPLASMGREAVEGARLGAADAGRAARLLDREFELLTESAVSPTESVAAAERLVERGAAAFIGGFGAGSCAALVDAAERLEVPFLNVATPDDRFRDEACSRMTFHVEASETMYLDACVHWLVRRGRQGLVNFVGQRQEMWRWYVLYEDSEQGRRLLGRTRDTLGRVGGELLGSTAIGTGGATAGGTTPVEALREARAADPWVVLAVVHGDSMVAVIREHRGSGSDFDLALPFADRLRYGDGASPGAFWPSLWHSTLFRYGARELNNRYEERYDEPMGPQAWASWTAVKLLGDLLVGEPMEEGRSLPERLVREVAFDGYKGPSLSFRPWNHQMGQAMYVLHPSVGDTVVDPFQVIGRVPLREADDQFVSRQLVDRLRIMGRTREQTACGLGAADATSA